MPTTSDSAVEQIRLKLTVTTVVMDQDHVLVVDVPRGQWTLDELHELARTVAEAAGILGEFTTAVSVDLAFYDSADPLPDGPIREELDPQGVA